LTKKFGNVAGICFRRSDNGNTNCLVSPWLSNEIGAIEIIKKFQNPEAFSNLATGCSLEGCGAIVTPKQSRSSPRRSRDETVAAKPTAAFDAKWGQFVIDPGFFTRLVYEGV
jgi:hypothetical protein